MHALLTGESENLEANLDRAVQRAYLEILTRQPMADEVAEVDV